MDQKIITVPLIREAGIADIPMMQIVRNSVKENVLSDPALVKDEDYVEYMTKRGKGWVCVSENIIAGFSIVDLEAHNIWALFVLPSFERMGIGRQLHDCMLEWYFSQTRETVWLSTAPASRAEKFYKRAGWLEAGLYGKGEQKFEMKYSDWLKIKAVTA
jgi:GNAT superfamily N-acetyltransferase